MGLCGLAATLAAVHFINPAITPFRAAFHVLGLFYNWPWLPGRRRLKQLYFIKNNASAAGFMITLFGYPLAPLLRTSGGWFFPPQITWATVVLTGLFFFLFEVSYEII